MTPGATGTSTIAELMEGMLQGIFKGCPDIHEARRLSDRLVGIAWHTERKGHKADGGVPLVAPLGEAIDGLEVVLAGIKNCPTIMVS